MERIIQKQIETMITGFQCPKNFICYRSGFKNLCRAKDIGLKSFVACLNNAPLDCKFSIQFGGIFFANVHSVSILPRNLENKLTLISNMY